MYSASVHWNTTSAYKSEIFLQFLASFIFERHEVHARLAALGPGTRVPCTSVLGDFISWGRNNFLPHQDVAFSSCANFCQVTETSFDKFELNHSLAAFVSPNAGLTLSSHPLINDSLDLFESIEHDRLYRSMPFVSDMELTEHFV